MARPKQLEEGLERIFATGESCNSKLMSMAEED